MTIEFRELSIGPPGVGLLTEPDLLGDRTCCILNYMCDFLGERENFIGVGNHPGNFASGTGADVELARATYQSTPDTDEAAEEKIAF